MKQKKRAAQTQGFADLTSNAVVNKLKPFVQQVVGENMQSLVKESMDSTAALATRVVCMENILCEKFGMTRNDLAERIADEEDKVLGMEKVEKVEAGDTVRAEVVYINTESNTVIGTRRQLIHDVGIDAGNGPVFPALLGLDTGATTDIKIPGNDKLLVKMTANRISRKLKTETANG